MNERPTWLRSACLLTGLLVLIIVWTLAATGALERNASIIIISLAIGAATWNLAERAHVPLAGDAPDQRRPIIYLRPFGLDRRTGRGITDLTSAEQRLAGALHALGPLTAVGRPGQRLPSLGASRLYVNDADWQDRICELIDEAHACVLRPGSSESMVWETSRVIAGLDPQRVLVLLPESEPEYVEYRKLTSNVFPIPLPKQAGLRARRRARLGETGIEGGIGGRISFGSGWEPDLRTWPREAASIDARFQWLVAPLFNGQAPQG